VLPQSADLCNKLSNDSRLYARSLSMANASYSSLYLSRLFLTRPTGLECAAYPAVLMETGLSLRTQNEIHLRPPKLYFVSMRDQPKMGVA
jgi:hypothetical protein